MEIQHNTPPLQIVGDKTTLLDSDVLSPEEWTAGSTDASFLTTVRKRLAAITLEAVEQTYTKSQEVGQRSWRIQALCAAELRERTGSLSGGRGRTDTEGTGRTAAMERAAKVCGVTYQSLSRDAQIGGLLRKTPLNVQNSLHLKSYFEAALRSPDPEATLREIAAAKALNPKFSASDARRLANKSHNETQRAKRAEQASRLPAYPLLIQGDSREVLARVIAPKSIKLILTDPPYGIAADGSYRKTSPTFDVIAGDESLKAACDLLAGMLAASQGLMADDCHLLVFSSWQHLTAFQKVIEDAGYKLGTPLVWNKNEGAAGDTNDFACTSELIIHATRGHTTVRPRIGNVFTYPPQYDTEHPFQKPDALLRELIKVTTVRGELVADPFCGSGSAVAAALSLDRRAVGIEIDPGYCDIARLNLDRHLAAAKVTGVCSDPVRDSDHESTSDGERSVLHYDHIVMSAEQVATSWAFNLRDQWSGLDTIITKGNHGVAS